jgi:hypothetical protein
MYVTLSVYTMYLGFGRNRHCMCLKSFEDRISTTFGLWVYTKVFRAVLILSPIHQI